jgi:3-oxoacyl-[acyl-carrier-protein] synthase III
MGIHKSSISIPISQFKITGYGMYLAPLVETAEELAPRLNKSPHWIISRAGVKERRVSVIDVFEMGALAIKEAVGNKQKPDLIINASGFCLFPTASFIAKAPISNTSITETRRSFTPALEIIQ